MKKMAIYIHKEYIKYIVGLNIYVSNIGAPNFMKWTLMDIKDYMGPDIVIVDNFDTSCSSLDMNWKSTKKPQS